MTDVMAFIPNGVIAVEAKVNEPFDDVVSDWIERKAESKPTSPPHRRRAIQRYADALKVTRNACSTSDTNFCRERFAPPSLLAPGVYSRLG
jgi:hypothetical protein